MNSESTQKEIAPFVLLVLVLAGILAAVKIYDERTHKLDEIGKKLYTQIVGL